MLCDEVAILHTACIKYSIRKLFKQQMYHNHTTTQKLVCFDKVWVLSASPSPVFPVIPYIVDLAQCYQAADA